MTTVFRFIASDLPFLVLADSCRLTVPIGPHCNSPTSARSSISAGISYPSIPSPISTGITRRLSWDFLGAGIADVPTGSSRSTKQEIRPPVRGVAEEILDRPGARRLLPRGVGDGAAE